MPTPNLPPGFDFTDPDIYTERLPMEEFAELRTSAPIWWNEQAPGNGGGFHDGGFWAITKLNDVKEVSRRSDVFSSSENGVIPRFNNDIAREDIDVQRAVMLNMDAPHHTRLRKIISRGFTPRAVGRLHDELHERAQNIAKAAAAAGSGDFVEQVSCELPLQAIAGLLGVPQEDRDKLFRWSNEMTGNDDPEYADIDPKMSSAELIMYAMKMAEEKAKNPGDDIVTQLIEADIDGEKLSDDEFGFFVVMLAVAGNETTRNSITQGMMAFADHPDQWELYKKERPETAADEIVRWATPVTSFQRTALEDYELSGVQIKKGQRVMMFYRSANFDEEVFDDPYTFNILRDPNPHVGFGGTGAHYCIGANLARMTINLIFNAVADNMPDLKPISAPERLRSGWLNGIKHWQVDYTGKCPVAQLMDFTPDPAQQAVADVVTSVLDRDNTWEALGRGRRDGAAGARAAGRRRRRPARDRDGADRDRSPRPDQPGAGHPRVRRGAAAGFGLRRAAGPLPRRPGQGLAADRGAERTRHGAAGPARDDLRAQSAVAAPKSVSGMPKTRVDARHRRQRRRRGVTEGRRRAGGEDADVQRIRRVRGHVLRRRGGRTRTC